MIRRLTKSLRFAYAVTVKTCLTEGRQTDSFGEYIEQQGRKRQNMEAKKFGQFIAGIRKEKKMTQAELAGKIHVTDKAISRWERGVSHS